MADRPRFGPAGFPADFKELKRPREEAPKYLRDEGLDALEYQATRWGPEPQMTRVSAESLGANAGEHDVWLTVHGSYFINLCGDDETVEASKKRLVACVTAAGWMGAHTVVFHPGFYGKRTPQDALQTCIEATRETVETIRTLGIRGVRLGPETTGKRSQLGGLDEVLRLCEAVEMTEPVVDWAHLHARGGGLIRAREDYERVLGEVENRLGGEAAKKLHTHFTAVDFNVRGEKAHHTLSEPGYGPPFEPLAELICELGLRPVVISESPVLDHDSILMRDALRRVQRAMRP